MSNSLIGLFMALGVAAWVYKKMHRYTGGNVQNALVVAGLVGLLAFLATITLFNFLPN